VLYKILLQKVVFEIRLEAKDSRYRTSFVPFSGKSLAHSVIAIKQTRDYG